MNTFKGFSKNTLKFFKQLEINNSKQWFTEHKEEYEKYVKNLACEFVNDMGLKLNTLPGSFNAIPKINKSLFKLNRDVRFSKNKSPYKTNMGIWFWEGTGKRMECSGFYFHLENNKLMLGCGIYMFTKDMLKLYRDTISNKKQSNSLIKILNELTRKDYTLANEHYKKIPRGYEDVKENTNLLLFNGMHAMIEIDLPDEFFSEKIIDYCLKHFKAMYPLHEWLAKIFH